jgi:hypothetical protein
MLSRFLPFTGAIADIHKRESELLITPLKKSGIYRMEDLIRDQVFILK